MERSSVSHMERPLDNSAATDSTNAKDIQINIPTGSSKGLISCLVLHLQDEDQVKIALASIHQSQLEHNEKVLWACLFCYWPIYCCIDSPTEYLALNDGCKAVVDAIKAHPTNAEIARLGCIALDDIISEMSEREDLRKPALPAVGETVKDIAERFTPEIAAHKEAKKLLKKLKIEGYRPNVAEFVAASLLTPNFVG